MVQGGVVERGCVMVEEVLCGRVLVEVGGENIASSGVIGVAD